MSETVTTEGGSEVTFVQGQAVHQTTEGEAPEGDHGDEVAAAKAAVKKALQEEGKKAAKETKEALEKDPLVPRGQDGKFLSKAKPEDDSEPEVPAKPTPKPKTEADEDTSALKSALAQRKEMAKAKAEAQQELNKAREEARQMYQQLQQERTQLQQERQRLEILKTDPVRAIRENGWNPEDFILDIANDGTPEGQLRRQQRELQQQLKELNNWKQQQAEERQRQAQEYEVRQRQAYRQQVEREFLKTALDESKHPHLYDMYQGSERSLLAEGDMIAEEYRKATGEEATFQDIAEYLEERAAKWYKKVSGRHASVVPSGQQVVPVASPPPGVSGKRTLSPASSGERRTLGNTLKDLDGDERLEAAREAVRAALAATHERT